MITNERLNKLLIEEIERIKSLNIELEETIPEVKIINRANFYGINKYKIYTKTERVHEIYISKYFLNAPEEEIRTVIAHEVAHSVVGAIGHKSIWQNAVYKLRKSYDYMNADYHLNLHPYSKERNSYPHTDLERKSSTTTLTKIYKLYCSKCGKEFTYKRKCKAIKYPWRYFHKVDHGTLTNKKAL